GVPDRFEAEDLVAVCHQRDRPRQRALVHERLQCGDGLRGVLRGREERQGQQPGAEGEERTNNYFHEDTLSAFWNSSVNVSSGAVKEKKSEVFVKVSFRRRGRSGMALVDRRRVVTLNCGTSLVGATPPWATQAALKRQLGPARPGPPVGFPGPERYLPSLSRG